MLVWTEPRCNRCFLGRIYDIVMAFQAHCEDENATHQHYLQQLWRYVVAAHLFQYPPN